MVAKQIAISIVIIGRLQSSLIIMGLSAAGS
jgi:hypothetical protein